MRSASSDCANAPDRLKTRMIGWTNTDVPMVSGQPRMTRTLKKRAYASFRRDGSLTKYTPSSGYTTAWIASGTNWSASNGLYANWYQPTSANDRKCCRIGTSARKYRLVRKNVNAKGNARGSQRRIRL